MNISIPASKLYSLQYIRGIAALAVLFYHLQASLNNVYAQTNLGELIFSQGQFGVELFFVLSGFIICFSTERIESRAVIKFLIRRIFRIYPLLILCVTAYYFLLSSHYDLHYYSVSVLGFNFNYKAAAPFFGWNVLPTAWSISYELSFYFLFAIAMLISHKYRILLACILVIGAYLSASYYFNHEFFLYFNKSENHNIGEHNIFYLFTSPMFLEFIYGMLIYVIYHYFRNSTFSINSENRYPIKFLIILSIIYLIALIASDDKNNPHILLQQGPLAWGLIAAMMLSLSIIYETLFSTNKSHFLDYLGEISYSLYISHMLIFDLIYRKFGIVKQNGITPFIMSTIFAIIIAIILHHLIEKPLIHFSKKLIKRF